MASATANRIAMAVIDVGADFSRFFRDVARQRNAVQSSMSLTANLATSMFRGAIGLVTEFTSHIARLGVSFITLGGALTAGLSMAAFVQQTREAYRVFEEFQYGMARVGAVTEATRFQFAALAAEARRLGAETEHTASDAATAMNFFAKSGFTVKEIMAATPAALDLATVGMVDMGTSADIVAKIMKGAGVEAADVGHAVDVMAKVITSANTDLVQLGEAFKYAGPIGKLFGMSIEESAAAIQMMSDAGIQGSMAGTSLRNILMRLASPSKEVARLMKDIGFEAFDKETGKLKDFGTILDELKEKTSKMTDKRRGQVLGDIGGVRAGAALMEMVDQGGDIFRGRVEESMLSEGFAARVRERLLATVQGSRQIMESVAETVQLDLGLKMEDGTRDVFHALIDSLPSFGEALGSLKPVFESITGNVTKLIEEIARALGTDKSKDLLASIAQHLSMVVENVASNFEKMGVTIEKILPWMEQMASKAERAAAAPSAVAQEMSDSFWARYYHAASQMIPSMTAGELNEMPGSVGQWAHQMSGMIFGGLGNTLEQYSDAEFASAEQAGRIADAIVSRRENEEFGERLGSPEYAAGLLGRITGVGPLAGAISDAVAPTIDSVIGSAMGMAGSVVDYAKRLTAPKNEDEPGSLHVPEGSGVISDVLSYLNSMQEKLLRSDNEKRIADAAEKTADHTLRTADEMKALKDAMLTPRPATFG